MPDLKLTIKSKGRYKGIMILEAEEGFALYLGMEMHLFSTLPLATHFIDLWYEAKKN